MSAPTEVKIIRGKIFLPTKPYRISNQVFEEYKKWKTNEAYIQLNNGINPLTNRKIQLHGQTFKKVKRELKIPSFNQFILKMTDEDMEAYIAETTRLYDIYEVEFKKKSKLAADIQKLDSFFKYVEIDNQKYGLPEVLNGVHWKDDCKGRFILHETLKKESYECNLCRNWNGCQGRHCDGGTSVVRVYRCETCSVLIDYDPMNEQIF